METQAKPKRSKQGPLVIWHGMTIRQMMRLLSYGPLLHWRRTPQIASLPLFALYNSAMGLMEKAVYGRRIEQVQLDKPPVFVIGHWRSGTTLLHNLLAQDPQFNYPKMYEVVFPSHFLLTENVIGKLTAPLVPQSRPMDNVPAGWDVPQEEDIAMAILTCLSPYMMLAQPDRNDLVRPFWDLSLLSEDELNFWKQEYLRFLKKVTYGDNRRLVLKSPVNTLRIPLLLEMFPDARFIYIYRNPFDVYNSAIHLRKTMFRENSLGFPHLSDLEESIYWVQEFAYRVYHRDKLLIPEGRLHEVRFEDLEQDPLGEMEKVYSAINLDNWDVLRERIEPQVPALRRYKKNQFRYTRELMDQVYERLQFIFEQHGYPHPAEQFETVAA